MARKLRGSDLPTLPDNHVLVVVSRRLMQTQAIKRSKQPSGVCTKLSTLLSHGDTLQQRRVTLNLQRFRICTSPVDDSAPIDTRQYDRTADATDWFSPDYETLLIMTPNTYATCKVDEEFRYRPGLAFSGVIKYLTNEDRCNLPCSIYQWPRAGAEKALVSYMSTLS